jgi:pimeloyl-ACP methyl ester carboxylesterase
MSRPMKSTNVRSEPPVLRALKATLRAVESGSPEAAAALAERVMFRTFRSAVHPGAQAILASGQRFAIPSPRGELAAWRWGSGPTVLLLHGWNGHAGHMASLVEPLVTRGLSPVAFDAPGHGISPGHESSLFDFADSVDAAIDAVRTPFGALQGIVAHSMGGAAVTYAMSRHDRAPAVTRERALRESGGLPARRLAFVAPPIDVGDFIHGFGRRFGLGARFEAHLRDRVEARFGVAISDVYAPDLARTLQAPLLVVHDEDDREVPVERGRTLVQAWPGARLEATRGLGHLRILRDPGVLETLADFVAGGDEAQRAA